MIKRIIPVLLLLPLLMISCVTQKKVQQLEIIAHAGGEIDGYVYTNSREALHSAVEKGYKYIEFDLQLTSDSVLVAAHSWSDFNRMTGHEQWGDSVPALEHFLAQRIHGRYTPLTAEEINRFFMDNENLFLVTDKVSDPALLSRNFPALKDRMVVEAFSYGHYEKLVESGYFRVLYSCMADDLASAVFKNLLFAPLFPGKRIEWIALHTSGFYYRLFRFIDKTRSFKVALFTIDNYNEITPEQLERVNMIYTNTLIPE